METVMNAPYYGYNACGLLYEQGNPALSAQRAMEIYNLRSRHTPIEMAKQERSNYPHSTNKRERKTQGNRSRSLYNKRLLVNARERDRMKTLNKGFENLRNALPCYIADGHISKITTLRLAINYIKTLSAVLEDGSDEHDTLIEEKSSIEELNYLERKTDNAGNVLPLTDASKVVSSFNSEFLSLTMPTKSASTE